MTAMDFDVALERYHRAAANFINGDPQPYKALFSHADDVTVANPFGARTANGRFSIAMRIR